MIQLKGFQSLNQDPIVKTLKRKIAKTVPKFITTLWFGNRLLFSSKASSKTQALSLFKVCNQIIFKGYFINWPLRTSVLSPTSERWESSGRLRLLTKASVKVGKTGLSRDLVTPRFNSPIVQIMVACKDKIVIMITIIRSLKKGEQSF